MTVSDSRNPDLRTIRIILVLFVAALVVSGVTAFPLLREMEWLASWRGLPEAANPKSLIGMDGWIVVTRGTAVADYSDPGGRSNKGRVMPVPAVSRQVIAKPLSTGRSAPVTWRASSLAR